MRYVATLGERTVIIEVAEDGRLRHVTVDDVGLDVEWQPVGGAELRATPGALSGAAAGHYSLLVGPLSYDIYIQPVAASEAGMDAGAEQVFEVSVGGLPYVVRLEDERARALAGLAGGTHERGEAKLVAPMPGMVSNIMAEVGQTVQRGQTVVVLEAMKMENDLGSPRAGVVRAIRVSKGQTVGQGQVLAVIGDPEGAASAPDEEEELG